MKRKGFTLIELVAGIAILLIIFVAMSRIMIGGNIVYDSVKESSVSRSIVNSDMYKAIVEDMDINNTDDNTSDDVFLYGNPNEVTVNGTPIDYEYFYTKDSDDENLMDSFAFNFSDDKVVMSGGGTDTSGTTEAVTSEDIFPTNYNYEKRNEPHSVVEGDNVIVEGLIARTGTTSVPRLGKNYLEYIKNNTNFYQIDEIANGTDKGKYIYNDYMVSAPIERAKWSYITQKLINEGITNLVTQKGTSDDKSSGTLENYHVLYFEREFDYLPVLLPNGLEIDVSELGGTDEEVNFVFLTNGNIGSFYDYLNLWYSTNLNSTASEISIQKGDVNDVNIYFVSRGELVGTISNFKITSTGNGNDLSQVTFASAEQRRSDMIHETFNYKNIQINKKMRLSGENVDMYVYSPKSLVYLDLVDDNISGGFILKDYSYISKDDKVTEVKWQGAPEILGYNR
ncbi:MAG: prepilin-type N-terminal cleavage/methylation domain-containing protein [Lachnospirales bacterium]